MEPAKNSSSLIRFPMQHEPQLRRLALIVVALLASATLLPSCTPKLEDSNPIVVREVLRDFLEHEPDWEVLGECPNGKFGLGSLQPARAIERGGAVLTSVILPPPAGVAFVIPGDLGPANLRTSSGIHHRLAKEPGDIPEQVSIHFSVSVNGQLIDNHRLEVPRGRVLHDSAWHEMGAEDSAGGPTSGGAEILVRGGDRVELRTWCEDAAGKEWVPSARLLAGFGRLSLEARRMRSREKASPEKPNIILFVQDTLRRDRLSTYGYGRPTAPRLDQLAERGIVFENAYAASSWTWPSTASMLSGVSPERHGVRSERSCYLSSQLDLLPEALQRAGYSTAGFAANGLINESVQFDQGFEHFVSWSGRFAASKDLMPRALTWMREHRDERFFLYVHLVDTHGFADLLPESQALFVDEARDDEFVRKAFDNYSKHLRRIQSGVVRNKVPMDELVPLGDRESIQHLYDAAVHTGDHWLGQLLDELDELGLSDQTVLAFTSDHGEEIFDRGLGKHGHSLYSELVRIPLVLSGPGVGSGERNDDVVSNQLLAPTLAQLAGVRLRGLESPGSLLDSESEPVFFSTHHGLLRGRSGQAILRGVRQGPWVLHLHDPEEGQSEKRSLYRIDEDPGETRDVVAQFPERADQLEQLLREHAASERALAPGVGRAADDSTLEFLEDIGYIGDD